MPKTPLPARPMPRPPDARPPDAPPARPRLAPGVDCLGADLAVRFRPMAGPSFTLPRVRSAAALPKPRSGRKRSPAWPIIPGSGRAVACHWRGDGWRRCGIGKAIPPPRPPAPSAPLTCRQGHGSRRDGDERPDKTRRCPYSIRTGCTDARAARTDGELGELGAALEALEAGAPPEEPPMFTGIWNLLIVILKDAETPLQSAAP